jgi:hypothetical protein
MAARCSAIARSGARCSSPVLPDSAYCFVHCPSAADRRREASKKGGRNRANKARAAALIPQAMSAEDLAGWLSHLFKEVMSGRIEPRVGTAAATIAKALMDVRQAGEVEERLAALEAQAGVTDHRWRA